MEINDGFLALIINFLAFHYLRSQGAYNGNLSGKYLDHLLASMVQHSVFL